MWLYIRDKELTWDVLKGINRHGASRCPSCKEELETITQLLISWSYPRLAWDEKDHLFGIKDNWKGFYVDECFTNGQKILI